MNVPPARTKKVKRRNKLARKGKKKTAFPFSVRRRKTPRGGTLVTLIARKRFWRAMRSEKERSS